MVWKKFSGEVISTPIITEVEATIEKETLAGNKLKVCIHQERTSQKMSIKERMLSEVQKSIECAYSLCDLLDLYDVDLEVHADINTNPMFKSNAALHEAMGYILSMGFVFKAKPEAFASSYCANKIVQ
jgi:uncharacterized protein